MSRAVREIRIEGDLAFITLTKGYVATIDSNDAPKVIGNNWCALTSPRRKAVYAVRVEQKDSIQRMIFMHRVIADAPDELHVDHKDGNGLNNRRENVRTCTQAQNNINTGVRADNKSGYKGVFWETRSRRWRSEIRRNGRSKHLGYFQTAELAYEAYSKASLLLHGEFARES